MLFFEQNLDVKRTDFVQKKEIDRSTLYTFDTLFCLFHADVGHLEFLGKNATFPQNVLVLVDLFLPKVYPMKSRKQLEIRTILQRCKGQKTR